MSHFATQKIFLNVAGYHWGPVVPSEADGASLVANVGFSLTLLPTVIVSKWVPSSFETQSSITVCFGAIADGVLPISLMYFLTPSNVERLGTEVRPEMLKKDAILNSS